MKIIPNVRFNMSDEDKRSYITYLDDLLENKLITKKLKKVINQKLLDLINSVQ